MGAIRHLNGKQYSNIILANEKHKIFSCMSIF